MADVTGRIETFPGSEGTVSVRVWRNPSTRHVVVIAHGYGEHIGRYEHVADRLFRNGATVWGPDHLGHGRSDGERALVRDFEHVVDDLHHVVSMAGAAHPNLPIVLIGHSMGGMIAVRYAQRFGQELAGLVLSGPAIGRLEGIELILAVLSRDPTVGEAYARDPLVYHGPFKRPTLEAFRATRAAIEAGPGFGALPTLWVHGSDDKLAPLADVRAGLAKLRGIDFTAHVYEGAEHEVFNETNQTEVLDEVCAFVKRVTR